MILQLPFVTVSAEAAEIQILGVDHNPTISVGIESRSRDGADRNIPRKDCVVLADDNE
jgi:hypothetical protein